MNDKIKKYVRDTMKSYGVCDYKLQRELISACCDEYNMQTANGVAPYEAYEAAILNVDDIVKGMVKPGNKFGFSLGMGILALVISIGEMVASLLVANVEFYNVEMLIACALWAIIIILYAIVCRHSLRWYNFLILALLLVSWVVTVYMLLSFFLFEGLPGSWRELEFIFPCVFEERWHRPFMGEGAYETDYKVYLNFLVSAVTFITTLALFIHEKVKKTVRIN